MRIKNSNCIMIGVCLLIFSSCSIHKHLPEGKVLLTKNKLIISKPRLDSDTSLIRKERFLKLEVNKSEVEGMIEQKPNSHFLGVPLGLRIYCMSSPDKNNFINRFLRKYGQPPVVYSQEQAQITVEKLKQYLFSKGVFESSVSYTTQLKGTNKIQVEYDIIPTKRYKINKVTIEAKENHIKDELVKWPLYSVIIPGKYYDQEVLAKERENLVRLFKNRGYYAFNRELIKFDIDTNLGNNYLNIKTIIEKPIGLNDDSLERDKSFEKFYIKDFYVSVTKPPKKDTVSKDSVKIEKLKTRQLNLYRKFDKKTNHYTFHYDEKKIYIRPKVIDRSLFLDEGDLYQLRRVENTYTGLDNLQNFQLVDISFKEHTDTAGAGGLNKIDAIIKLYNTKRHSFSTALEVSNTASSEINQNVGNFGLEWNFAYRNKNLFRGAEIFELKNKLVFEFPKDIFLKKGEDVPKNALSTFETGLDASLELPQFLMPFISNWFPRNFRPRTTINLGYNVQLRTTFNRTSITGAFGYKWRSGIRNMHQLLPFELNVVKINIKDDGFLSLITDPRILYKYTNHLVTDTRYNYIYSGQTAFNQREFFYASVGLESAGNILYLIDKLLHSKSDSMGIYEKFGVPYSQYLRTTIELKQYLAIANRSTFVLRVFGGIGIPYQNSLSLPYEKSFFAGGSSNIRAWRMRSIGPGSFMPDTNNSLLDRIGDLTLIGNIEARFPLYSIFDGALFLDAGNVWLLRESPNFPGGKFNLKSFYKEIAIGGGIGFRINIFISTFRIDFAMPIYNPSSFDSRWMIKKWKWSDLVVNWGIGFPF